MERIRNDGLTFSDEGLETLGINNPVCFSDINLMVIIIYFAIAYTSALYAERLAAGSECN